jgi:hypothetical protein
MLPLNSLVRRSLGLLLAVGLPHIALKAAPAAAPQNGLLFYLSCDEGTTPDFSAAGTKEPNFVKEITPIKDGAKGGALSCGHTQLLSYWAPGNIYAQRGTLSFFWRAREPVGPTEFVIFRVGNGDHSSWDMAWLRIDYNGHGFDAFVTDVNLARTRVSVALDPFPKPNEWTHLTLSWDETSGIRFYVNGKLAASQAANTRYDAALDQFGPHSRIISPHQVQSDYNFIRGGDIDEIRIYDRMLDDEVIASETSMKSASMIACSRTTTSPPWPKATYPPVCLPCPPAASPMRAGAMNGFIATAGIGHPIPRPLCLTRLLVSEKWRYTTPTTRNAGGGKPAMAFAKRPGPACITVRVCRAATIISNCPTGIATSSPARRSRFICRMNRGITLRFPGRPVAR